ncbi:MAG: RnfABCDGE type electron transport complex subunit D, partial [Lachnoclostridium sp.]|nr:RnfABCDGE type electron transport complex subunit D [Lachnoclostridium sp.]
MSDLYHVSASPHVRSDITTKKIMADVCIALVPATLFGIGYFGLNALLLIVSTCVACVLTEYTYKKCMKLPLTTSDNSAFLTGLLLALNLPPELPVWMAVLGGIFAILIVKQLFGGLGQNFMNPALAGRCFLVLCFTTRMTSFVVEKSGEFNIMTGYSGIDGISGATPLAVIKDNNPVNVWEMFMGTTGGTIGETSTL